jgi:hypothetical protein
MTRIAKIEARIAQTTDRKLLALLNRAHWVEKFGLWPKKQERKAA